MHTAFYFECQKPACRLLNIKIQWNPALRPPGEYDDLVITATFLGPPGKTALHFLVKENNNNNNNKNLVNTITR